MQIGVLYKTIEQCTFPTVSQLVYLLYIDIGANELKSGNLSLYWMGDKVGKPLNARTLRLRGRGQSSSVVNLYMLGHTVFASGQFCGATMADSGIEIVA